MSKIIAVYIEREDGDLDLFCLFDMEKYSQMGFPSPSSSTLKKYIKAMLIKIKESGYKYVFKKFNDISIVPEVFDGKTHREKQETPMTKEKQDKDSISNIPDEHFD